MALMGNVRRLHPEKEKTDKVPQNVSPISKQSAAALQDLGKFLSESYDPDAEFRPLNNPVASMFSRFLEALFVTRGNSKEASNIPGVEYAKIVEVNKVGGYRVRTIETNEEFRAALLAAEKGWKKVNRLLEKGIRLKRDDLIGPDERNMRESFFDNEDPAQTIAGTDGFQEYTPIMGGPFSKQLYLHDMLDGFAKAFEAYNHNPIAHQGINITTDFVLGRGVGKKACHPECQKRLDEWWDEQDLDHRLEMWCTTIARDGELMLKKVVDPIKKELGVRWMDPSTCWEIVTDLEDQETGIGASSRGVIYYHFQYPTQYQILFGGAKDQVYNPSNFQSAKFVILQVPADEMLFYKINVGPNEKRGRSDLFPVLGWLKRYKDFWTAHVLRAIITSTFAWKNKIKGSDADVSAFISAFGNQQPKFGSVWVENEASELTPMTVDLKASEAKEEADGIINMIAVGLGIPMSYLGFGEHQARASAVVASEPGTKKFQARQILMGRILRDVAQAWGALEISSGRLPAEVADESGEVVPHKIKIDFQFPEIAIEDRTAKIKDIDFAVVGGYMPHEDGANMINKELGRENSSYKDDREKIKNEEISRAQDLYNRPAPIPTDPQVPQGSQGAAPDGQQEPPAPQRPAGMSGQERRAIKLQHRS